jgi:hypothetical protein
MNLFLLTVLSVGHLTNTSKAIAQQSVTVTLSMDVCPILTTEVLLCQNCIVVQEVPPAQSKCPN